MSSAKAPTIRTKNSSTNKEDMEDPDDKPIQYTSAAGAFIRCGRTRKTVDPGFYDVVNVGQGVYGLKPKVAVSDELIDLPGTVADEIFADIGKFMETGEQYAKYGLTHKRGYLFYGPHGSGKTSLGLMLAKRFIERVGGVVMYAGGVGEFYHGVSIMRDVEPGRPSMYLIEEADAIVNNTHCLSILDGELSIQGAVFVAMTNYKNKLPPRIANRPGRFDRVTLVNCPPEPVQLEYLRRIAERDPAGMRGRTSPELIVKALSGLPMSMAHLREAFIANVLMGVTLPDLRKRFEIMAGVRNDDGDMAMSLPELPESDVDDDSDDPNSYARREMIDGAKNWSPTDDL